MVLQETMNLENVLLNFVRLRVSGLGSQREMIALPS